MMVDNYDGWTDELWTPDLVRRGFRLRDAEIEKLRAALECISKRDGSASDHCACFDCRDSSDEAKAALKGEDDEHA